MAGGEKQLTIDKYKITINSEYRLVMALAGKVVGWRVGFSAVSVVSLNNHNQPPEKAMSDPVILDIYTDFV